MDHYELFTELPEVMDVNCVAGALSVCAKSIRKEISAGRLGCIRVGKAIRVTKDQLIRYLNRQEVSARV